MSRIEGVSPERRPLIGFIYRAARREVRRMTGKSLLTPDIPVRAHRLSLLFDLYRYRESEHFDERERLILDLAVAMTVTPVQVSDGLMAALAEQFDEAQLVELVNLIAVENLRSRFNAAFGLGAAGFSEGMACARMEPGALAPMQAVGAA